MGDREIDYNPEFRLILQTKLANPHYKPVSNSCQNINVLLTITVISILALNSRFRSDERLEFIS